MVSTLEQAPRNATHWSRTSMAAKSGLSKSTIGRIWRDFDLKPHRADAFKLSTDPRAKAKSDGHRLAALSSAGMSILSA